MPWGNSFFPLLIVTAGGGFQGFFVYSPGPGANNLIESVAAQAGTDPYGNQFLAGETTYNNGAGFALNLSGNAESFYSGSLAGGWTQQSIISSASGGILQVATGTQGGGDAPLTARFTSKNGSADGLIASLQLQGNNNRLLTSLVTAWFPDGSFTTPETWHDLGSLGAHYTVVLGRYRLTPNNEVEVDIKVVGDGLQATSVTFATTLPVAYRPATTHDSLPMGTTRQVTAGDIWPRLTVDTAGNVTVINQGTANTFATCLRIPLD